MADILPAYAELWCLSNFSFLRGASHPHELVARAAQQGYQALALTDECSMAGVVRAHVAAKEHQLPLLVGTQFAVRPVCGGAPFTLVALACNLRGYGNLCALITKLRRKSPKGQYQLAQAAIQKRAFEDCVVLVAPDRDAGSSDAQLQSLARWMRALFGQRCWIAAHQACRLDDEMWLARLQCMGEPEGIPLVAAGDVHMHVRSRKPLQDVLTATRTGQPLSACGHALQPNAELHLRHRLRLAQLYPPELLAQTLVVASHCHFSLDELRYQYPDEVVPAGETPIAYLRRVTYEGAARRWSGGINAEMQERLEKELGLIAELRYEHYFLTVYDIVHFARSQRILCQGRGSAANSVVCYCLGVTEVNPAQTTLLFERFLSKERDEPPDIDIDFEHERREEVIQYLYEKYGRHRAALTAVVISYRSKSAIRDVGKALGFAPAAIDQLCKSRYWWDGDAIAAEALAGAGLHPDDLAVRQLQELTQALIGFPRHLSQHVGGFVLTRGPLSRMVPVERAAMDKRTVIEWDKDDLDAMGLLKVDVLSLGMLTALRKALALVNQSRGEALALQDIPPEDPATYDMICEADTLGTFQVESRAQMSMLPRLRPRSYYDLVVQVAIVRPGPIQGGMVHPYLRRRQGLEPIHYENDDLKPALKRTLGVPIFQEQVMQIAMLAANFTPGEADQLRRAMAAWKRHGDLAPFRQKLIDGMLANHYPLKFAESIFEQIKGFASYGFPESHAASFAILVYYSCWLKRHHPAEFLAAMLNSQPLGFYSASQLVQDARRHGVEVRPVDVLCSDIDCTLEDLPDRHSPSARPAVRLGLRLVDQLPKSAAARIVQARAAMLFDSTQDLALRARLPQRELRLLAAADALASLEGHRRNQLWQATGHERPSALLQAAPIEENLFELPPAPEGEDIHWDYAALGLTLRRHPLALLRPRLAQRHVHTAASLRQVPDGHWVRCCGIVMLRQQPGTAKGTVFVSLEDETGVVQVICWPKIRDTQRAALVQSQLLLVDGRWQREGHACNLIARRLTDLSPWLDGLWTRSRDFH
ncbi:error-prone DNA polymerase [Comamonas humi]